MKGSVVTPFSVVANWSASLLAGLKWTEFHPPQINDFSAINTRKHSFDAVFLQYLYPNAHHKMTVETILSFSWISTIVTFIIFKISFFNTVHLRSPSSSVTEKLFLNVVSALFHHVVFSL